MAAAIFCAALVGAALCHTVHIPTYTYLKAACVLAPTSVIVDHLMNELLYTTVDLYLRR